MSEFIRKNNTAESGVKPVPDIEDAVLVEEEIKPPELSEMSDVSIEESVEVVPSELPNIDELNTLEEIDDAFALAKTEFERVSVGGSNNVILGLNLIHFYEGVLSDDKTTAKNMKLKYLKKLYSCISEFKSGDSTNDENSKESAVEISVTEKIKDVDEKFRLAKTKFEQISEDPSLQNEAPLAVRLGSSLISNYADLNKLANREKSLSEKKRALDLLEVRTEELEIALERISGIDSTEKPPNPEKVVNKEYQNAREEWKKTKETHREKKQEYDNALSEFYGKQSKFDKSVNSVKKFFGFQPELPAELTKLEEDYKSERNKYAIGLNSALKERGNSNGNKERLEEYNKNAKEGRVNIYDEKSDSFKIAFADKFILKPNQELLARQENNLLSESQKETLARISQKLGKHKWHLRGGMVIMAGTVGAMTGGLAALVAGAGWQAWKIATGIAVGAGAGAITKKAMQGRVDRAEFDIEKQTLKFDVNKLDDLEQDLLDAVGTRDKNLRQQKVASIAAAVIAGGVTSYNLAGVDSAEAASAISEKTSPAVDEFAKEIGRIIDEHPGLQAMVGDEVAADPLGVTETMVSAFEMPIAKDMSIPNYSFDGSVNFQTVITDLKIDSQGNLAENLTTTQKNAVEQYIKLTAIDQLSAHPNISQANLEAGIFSKLENKFGADEWWKNAQVKGVDIGAIEKNSVLESSGEIATSSDSEALSSSNENSRIIEVEKGDNLWNIIKAQYSMELNGLSTVEQNQVIDRLLDKVNANPELLKSMNIRSGDIDTIYPDEKINIGILEQELKILVELEKNDIDVPYTKSSSLDIKIEDPQVNRIPITFTNVPDSDSFAPPVSNVFDVQSEAILKSPPPLGYGNENPFTVVEKVVQTVPSEKIPTAPIFSNGNFFDTPDYKKFTLEVFGSEKNFNLAFNNRIAEIENLTYDIFNKGIYDSPYNFLKSMTLKEIEMFDSRSSVDIKADLGPKIKYNTYLAWVTKINDIRSSGVPYHPETKLSDLFSRYVVESNAMKLRKQ